MATVVDKSGNTPQSPDGRQKDVHIKSKLEEIKDNTAA